MKPHKIISSFSLAAMTFLSVAQASAQVATVTQIPGYFVGGGGEFNVSPVIGTGYGADAIVNNGFETFCISRDVSIAIPGVYYYEVNTNGVFAPLNLPLVKGSAWLYSLFSDGTLPNYRYAGFATPDPLNPATTMRASDAFNLQLAFWTLEGQYTYPDPFVNPYLVQVADAFGGGVGGLMAAMETNSAGGYNVGVLHLNTINPDLSIGSIVQPLLVRLSALPPPPRTNSIGRGDTATIGFWHNKNGQKLINSTPNSPALANWLAVNFPCLYGGLAGKANSVVAAYDLTLFNVVGQKTGAQILGVALATYLTSSTLAGNVAAPYGFNVSPGGIGGKTYNVGANGSPIGLSNNTSYTILQLLQQASAIACGSPTQAQLNALNVIFDGINESGDIL